MSIEISKAPWIIRAETAIRALRDVESATILADGEAIKEIHVLTRSSRPPKQIVRDIQTVLMTRFNRSIDYRVVSVAYLTPEAPGVERPIAPDPPAMEPPEPATRTLAPPESHETAFVAPLLEPSPAFRPTANPSALPSGTRSGGGPITERIRFGSVNLYAAGPRTQAQVELRWQGLPRMGSASGWSSRAGASRLVAAATVAAVQEFLADEIPLGVHDAEFLKLGRRRVVVVSLSLLVGRRESLLVGACAVEQDVQQAVVFATLAALNRVVAGMRPKETTEYVLRPTSA